MSAAWERLLAFVPTRRAAVALFLLAVAVYWIEALGWPMAKGRDTWDYLTYYLQLLDSDPPMSELQLFRTPLTPLVLGVPLDLGGSALLEIVFGVLYGIAILAWSAMALTFGRLAALASALLLLAYPAYATLYHQASSDAIFATALACWALLLARTLERPSGWRFAALGAGIAVLVLVRAANEILLPLALVPLFAAVPWRRRFAWTAACLAAAALPLVSWAVLNGVRYDSTTVQRGGRAWVPFLRVFTTERTIAPENGSASRRLAALIEQEVLAKEPHAGLGVTLDAYLANGSNYETVRLIALSDRVLGKDENYAVLFDSAVEAIRKHPGTYFRGVADTYWDFLMQAPLREGIEPREQTAPEAPAPTYESNGVVLPNPQAHVLLEAVPYGFVWCASDYIDSCVVEEPSLVWDDPALQRALPGDRRAGACLGRGAPLPRGRRVRARGPEPRHPTLPPTATVARGRHRRARGASPARPADDPRVVALGRPRAARARRIPGRRPGVRAARVPGLPRHGARRPRGGARVPQGRVAIRHVRRLASTG